MKRDISAVVSERSGTLGTKRNCGLMYRPYLYDLFSSFTRLAKGDMKLDEKKCKYCWGKRFYTAMFGMHGAEDFGGDGFEKLPAMHKIACPKCNRGNKRRIKGVSATMWAAIG